MSVLLLSVIPTTPASAVTAELPRLATAGNRIVTADSGQDVILRGANVLRSEWDLNMNTDRRAIPALANDWNGNVIMRGFASDPVLSGSSFYLGMLDEHVSLAASNGMYVVFAWRSHAINGPQPTMPDDRAQQALAILAKRYATRSNVMYGLQVEPHDVTWATLHPRFVSMVDAIHAAAAPNKPIVMVPGTNWGRDVSGAITQPVARQNVVYKSHPYNSQASFQKQFGDTYTSGKPVFIGEFGLASGLGMTMTDIEALMTMTQKLGLGWAAWCFDYQGGPALVTSNTTFAPTDPYGVVIKREMLNTPPLPAATTPAPADTSAPTVSITSPAAGTTVSGTAVVEAAASDNVGVTRVEFTVDGARVATTTAAPHRFTWDTTSLLAGDHKLAAQAFDAAGNSAATPAHLVTVSNPQLTWTPVNNDAFSYAGTWSTRLSTGLFRGDGRVSTTAGATAALTFTGTRARLFSTSGPQAGRAAVSVDGGPEKVVDLFALRTANQKLVFETPTLTDGTHTLRIRVTGTKARKAKGYEVVSDRIDVLRPTTVG